jgi:hydroxymethylglutaryl-CoA lyase
MMQRKMEMEVLVSEVGPRDGLQSISTLMSLEAKKNWIAAEAAAGVREIEVGSFVSPRLLPQMADTAELVTFAKSISALAVTVLVPNAKGAAAAIAAGVDRMSLPLSVSQAHSMANLRMTHEAVLEQVRQAAAMIREVPASRRPRFEGSLSTAFGCTLEGPIADSRIERLAAALIEAGCDEIGLSDTTGYANPKAVRHLIRLVRNVIGAERLTSIHLHNTRGLGLANVLAALESDVTTIDASLGGLGGCPFAPGASGNIVTEDLVFMLDSMGLRTGIDLDALIATRAIVAGALPQVTLYGFVAEAGLPLGYRSASQLAA